MGGLQAVISVTLIVGPIMTGLAFERLGVPAPYWIGTLLAALALLAALVALLPEHRFLPTKRSFAKPTYSEPTKARRSGGQTP